MLLMSRSVGSLSFCVKNKAASSSGGRSFLAWIGSVRVKHSEEGKAGMRTFIRARAEKSHTAWQNGHPKPTQIVQNGPQCTGSKMCFGDCAVGTQIAARVVPSMATGSKTVTYRKTHAQMNKCYKNYIC